METWGNIFSLYIFILLICSFVFCLLNELLNKFVNAIYQILPSLLSYNKGSVKVIEGFPGGPVVKNPPATKKTRVQFLGQEDTLKKGMATYSSILAWEIPWTEKPGGLQSMESQSQT